MFKSKLDIFISMTALYLSSSVLHHIGRGTHLCLPLSSLPICSCMAPWWSLHLVSCQAERHGGRGPRVHHLMDSLSLAICLCHTLYLYLFVAHDSIPSVINTLVLNKCVCAGCWYATHLNTWCLICTGKQCTATRGCFTWILRHKPQSR